MPDLSGQSLGRYHLLEQLGEGGMATVYKAYDTRLEREVAVKIIRSAAFPAEVMDQVLKRFEREAKALAKLSHPNIVKVHDYGEHEGSPYLVMEYLPGGTLKSILSKSITWQDAVRLLLPVAKGVAYAHQRGILHRDIKPANVLITDGGEPMLSDFGIAKLFAGEESTALTGSGMAIGTPEYMAPEQWKGETSPQSDLYSLGIMLYEMVAGRKPYIADTPAAILIKQATEPLPSPRKFNPDLPDEVEYILIKALAREPENRYADVNDFVRALEELNQLLPFKRQPVIKPIAEEIPKVALPEAQALTPVPPPAPSNSERTVKTPLPEKVDLISKVAEPEVVIVQAKTPGVEHGAKLNVEEPQGSIKVEGSKPAVVSLTQIKSSLPRIWLFVLMGVIGFVIFVLYWTASTNTPSTPVASETQTATSLTSTDVATSTLMLISTRAATITPYFYQTPRGFSYHPVTKTHAPTYLTPTPTPVTSELPAEITDDRGVTMHLVSAGAFPMGSDSTDDPNERPAHIVFVDNFYMDVYEVTNALFKECVAAGICTMPSSVESGTRINYYGDEQYSNYPIGNVTWDQAKAFCKWRQARLPSEAEWEKAARGIDGRMYPWGNEPRCEYANYYDCVGDATEVGMYESGQSPYGIYDLAGNVWEWVADVYEAYPGGDPNASESYGAENRVLRGGSWDYSSEYIRTTRRNGAPLFTVHPSFGFRCARDANP